MSSDPAGPGPDNADAPEKDGARMQGYDHCPNGHAVDARFPHCPWCGDAVDDATVTDGGLDTDTVKQSVAPGDVVEVANKPYRVVDVEGDILRLYDLVERTETLKDAGAGDVDHYVHRSEVDTIFHRVREERDRRDIDEDRDLVTDGGRLLCVRCNETYDRDEHDRCPNCTNFDIASFGGVER